MRWHPGKDLTKFARRFATRQAARLRSYNTSGKGSSGGSLASAMRRQGFVKRYRWGAVMRWASLGPKFLWFVRGTKRKGKTRQKARPLELAPSEAEVRQVVEASAAAHYAKAERQARARSR